MPTLPSNPGFFARLRQAFADHRAYLATYDELNVLSDRGSPT